MFALISPNENILDFNGNILGSRIVDIQVATFPIAPPLFWLICNNSVIASQYYADGANNIIAIPLPPPPPAPVINLSSYAANTRYTKETGGTTVGGIAVPTDLASQGKFAAAFSLAQAVPNTVFQWKTESGAFISLTANQLSNIAVSVAQFVNQCFLTEANVQAQISNGMITTTAQVDQAFA